LNYFVAVAVVVGSVELVFSCLIATVAAAAGVDFSYIGCS